MTIERMLAALAVALLLWSCGDAGEDEPAMGPDCGLPTPLAGVDESLVPEVFTLDGEGEIARAEEERGGFLASINMPYSVDDAFKRLRKAVQDGGYELIGEDFEGFEAELYLRRGEQLGMLQIRMSKCPEAVAVFVNIIAAPGDPEG